MNKRLTEIFSEEYRRLCAGFSAGFSAAKAPVQIINVMARAATLGHMIRTKGMLSWRQTP
jgi:hypothetical protein